MKTALLNKCKKRCTANPVLVLFVIIQFIALPVTPVLGGALPEDPVVQAGAPSITSDGTDMTINAGGADSTWIDWQGGFNIGAENSVTNLADSATAAILHNDVSGVVSNIEGVLNGNCNVFLLNPSGILFAPGAQINVGGLVASTLSMSMSDFLSKDYRFTQDSGIVPASIINAGQITAQNPAGVTLMGGAVRNEGVINANFGSVNLLSGSEVTLSVNTDGSIEAAVSEQVLSNVYDQDGNRVSVGVENIGDITANGGKVYMQAEAVNDVFDTLINQEGVVRAGSMVERDGKIVLTSGSEGIIENSGTMDVSGIEDGASGGEIEVTGDMIGQLGEMHADAQGDADGGNIDLYAGSLITLPDGSLTTANADENGDGGTVIAYSQGRSILWHGGLIEAKGGSVSGDGGFVEVSGMDSVYVWGHVRASAVNGEAGTFLIDPTTIYVANYGNANLTYPDGTDPYTAANAGDLVTNTDTNETDGGDGAIHITDILNDGTSVVLDTSNYDGGGPYAGAGDIIVDAAINYTGAGGNVSLIFYAADDIIINNSITASGAQLNVELHSNEVRANPGDDSDLNGGSVDVNAAITTNGGSFTSYGLNFNNTGGIITTGGGTVDIQNTGTVTIGANISAGSGDVVIDGGGAGADSIVDGGGTIVLSGGSLKLQAVGAIGTTSNFIETTGLTNFAAQSDTGGLYLRNSSSGTVHITAVDGVTGINADAGTVHLTNAAGGVTQSEAVTASSLAVDATSNVTLTEANDVGTLAIDNSSGNIQFTDIDGFSVGTVDGETGVDTDSGSVTLTSTTGNITVTNTAAANDIDATSTITINVAGDNDDFILSASADVETTAGGINISADDMTISGTITASGQTVSLAPTTAGDAVSFTSSGSSGVLEFTDAELDNITATTLRIGDADTGAITIREDMTPANITNLTLISDETISQEAGDTITVAGLRLITDSSVDMGEANDVNTLAADLSSGTGNFVFTDADDLTIGAVDGTTGITLNGGNINVTGSSTVAIGADVVTTSDGTITLTSSDNGGNDDNLSVSANVTIQSGLGDITLTGGQNVTLVSGALVQTGGAGSIDINADNADGALNDGDFSMGAATVLQTTGTGGITIDADDALTITNITSGGAVTIDSDGGGTISLNSASINNTDGTITLSDAVTLTGDSTVSSANGNVTFSSTVGGAQSLTASAANGIVTFGSSVGAVTDELTLLDVNANEARLGGNILTDGGTTADVDFRDTNLVTLTANVNIDTETGGNAVGGDVLFGTASTVTGDFDLAIDATGSGGNGVVQINDADVDQFTLTGVSTATLYGDIESDDAISMDGAATVTLAGPVTLTTTNADQNISIDNTTLNGGHALTIDSTGDVALDAVAELTGLTVTADSMDFTDTVSMPGDITVTVSDAATTDAIDVQSAVDSTNGSIVFNTASDSGAELNAALSAGQNVTINGLTTLATGAITVTADNGDIALNGDVSGAQDLTLAAANGDVELNTVGSNVDPTLLDINSSTATLDGATIVVAGNVLLDGVGQTTLVTDVSIDASGATGINLGDLTGAHALTLSATNAAGDVTLADANIQALTIDDGVTVSLAGDLVTTGNVAVSGITGEIDVASGGSIQAGGSVSLANNDSVDNVGIDINGAVTGATGVTMTATDDNIAIDADVTAAGDSTVVLNAVAGNVNIAQAAAAAVTSDNGTINIDAGTSVLLGSANPYAGQLITTGTGDIDIDAATAVTMAGAGTQIKAGGAVNIGQTTESVTVATAASGITATGNITVDADDAITVGGVIDSTAGNVDLEVSEDNASGVGTITLNANVKGEDVTITSADADAGTAVITVATALNNTRGGYTFEANDGTLDINSNVAAQDFIALNGGTAIQLAANLTATDENIDVNDALTLDGGNPTITATSGNVNFNSTVDGAQALTVNALSGTVGFGSTVGAATQLSSLTVSADTANLNGNISTDGGTTADVNFTGTDDVVLTANVVIDTETGGNDVGGDVLFKTTGRITGDYDLDIVTTGTTDGTVQIAAVDTNSLDIDSTNTTTLYGDITADDDVTLTGATDVNLAADVTILGDGSTAVSLDGGDVAGDFDLAIDAGSGAVALGAAAASIDVDVNKLTVTSSGTTTIGGDLRTDEGMDFSNAADVNVASGVTLYNTDSGTVDLSGGDVGGLGNLTIEASATDVKLDALAISGAAGALDVNSTGVTTLLDNITTNSGNVNLDGATNVVLGADVTINAGSANIDFSNAGANSLSGGYDLTLAAGAGTVQLDNISQLTSLTVSGSGTTQFVGDTDMNGAISVDATTLIDVDGATVTTGAITLDSDTNVDIDGLLTAGGNVDIDADNNVAIDADVTVDGNSIITITADSGAANNAGDLTIAQAANASITANEGNVTLEGENITLGTGALAGIVRTTGNGNIKITANREGTVGAGDFTIGGTGSELDSGGTIDVDDPWDVIIGGDGMTAVGNITVVADNDVDINAPVNSTQAGNISITADAGDILLSDEVRTTSTGDVTLIATAGEIDDDDAGTEDEYVAGDVVTMTAADGIGETTSDIDTQANSLDVSSTSAGDVVIDEYDAVILTDLDTANGSITVDADGQIIATDVNASGAGQDVTLTTSTGGMVLTSVLADDDISATADAGDITIALVGDAGTDDVTITATAGAIDEVDPEDGGVDVVADVLTLNAQDGVGQSRALEVNINTLNSSVTAPGDIVMHESDAVILNNLSTIDGSITVTAGGLITATSVNASGAGQDVTLSTTAGGMILTSVLADDDITATADAGDIVIDVVGDAGTDDVTLTATTGSITGADDDDDAAEITGDAVVLTAQDEIGGAIGGATAIETEVTTLSADSTLAGDIILSELDNDGDGINLLSIDSNNGNIIIQTNGGTEEAGTETKITSVISDTGVAGASEVIITASTGDITLAANSSNAVNVQSDDDVTLTATAGSIVEENATAIPGDSYVDIQGALLTITARDEIGSSTGEFDIETTITDLDASSTTAGDIVITETDAIILSDVDTVDGSIVIAANGLVTATDVNASGVGQDVTLTTTAGGMILTSVLADDDITATADAGDITVDVVGDAGTDNISVTATTGSINEVGAGDAAVDFTGNALTLTAQDEIGGTGELDIETTVASLTASSTTAGDIYVTETDTITLTSVTTTDGLVNVTSGGTMTVTEVTAGGDTGSNDDVILTTTAGDIVQSGDITALNDDVTLTSAGNITDTTDGTTDISAANLTISATSGTVGASGTNNELDTDVDTLTLAAQGDTYVLEDDAITLTSVVTTNGLVDIEAGGTITTNTITAGGSNEVNLYSTGGDIFDVAGGMITAGATSSIKAEGIIGTELNPVDVNVTGDLWVWANSKTDQISAILRGTVDGTGDTERVEIYKPSPPGLVIFDNHLMGGGNYGSGSLNGSILSRGYGWTGLAQTDLFNPPYVRTFLLWGHRITLPWILNEGAKIDADLLKPVPAVIDASGLNLPVLQKDVAPNYYVIYPFAK